MLAWHCAQYLLLSWALNCPSESSIHKKAILSSRVPPDVALPQQSTARCGGPILAAAQCTMQLSVEYSAILPILLPTITVMLV